jgi:hypothetical protein
VRLTLRTLLAYLDDTLEPAQAKLIGQKVAESEAAQQLIARIKDVVRRRRLGTPPATGPDAKVDANMTAEYIDSVLPAEKLAEVEEICLNSDVHLAEIAACHQVLTVVLSQPILVPPTAHRRMYALSRGREAIPYRKAALAPVGERARDNGLTEGADEADDKLLLGLPRYRREGSWFWRVAPILGVCLLVAALGAAIAFSLKGLWSHDDRLAARNRDTGPVAVNDNTRGGRQGAAEDHPQPIRTEPQPGRKRNTGKENARGKNGPGKAAGPDQTPPLPRPEGQQDQPKGKPVVKPVAARAVVGKYVQAARVTPSILLTRRTGKAATDAWERVRGPRADVYSSDNLLSLPGSTCEVRLNRGVRMELWGALPNQGPVSVLESEAVINNAPDVDVDVTLKRGRITLANDKNSGPARVRIHWDSLPATKEEPAQQETWEVTLDDSGSEVLVERWGTYSAGVPFNKDQKGDGPMLVVGLFILRGESHVKVGPTTVLMQQPPGPAAFLWDNVGATRREPQRLEALPIWFKKTPLARAEADAQEALSSRLDKEPVSQALTEGLKDREQAARMLAIVSLGAVNDLRPLLDAINDTDSAELRQLAMGTLQHWIGLAGDHDQKLYEAMLAKKYSASQAEIIMSLLHTYSAEQLRNKETWEELINYLTNDRVAIRELAYWHLRSLTPRGMAPAFDAGGNADNREAAVDQWRRLLDTNKLPPQAATGQHTPSEPKDSGRKPPKRQPQP